MSDAENSSLEQRVARLERQVNELVAEVRSGSSPSRAEAPAQESEETDPSPEPRARASDRTSTRFDLGSWRSASSFEWETEKWLGLVGIAFVVLSFGFLLKLSFDRGWITPALRLAAGFVTGGALVGVGVRLAAQRRILAQALLGGGVALLYASGLAGSELYGLLPWWLALSIMATTAVLSVVLSELQESPALAGLGVAGGLAAPFLIGVADANPGPVAVYASVVLLGAAPVQYRRGWLSLLAILVVGGAHSIGGMVFASRALAPILPVVLLLVVYWAIGVLAPVLRPKMSASTADRREAVIHRVAVAFATAVVAGGTAWHFSMDRVGLGWVLLALALVTGALGYVSRDEPRSVGPAGEVAALAGAVGLALVAGYSAGAFLVMIEVFVLLVLAERGAPQSFAVIAHWLALAVVVSFGQYSEYLVPAGAPGLREGALFRLGVFAVAVMVAPRAGEMGWVYRAGAYVGLMHWLAYELGPWPQGQALISIAWGLQGTVALLAGRTRRSRQLQGAGLGTLGVVAGKLLLVDLAALGPVWRILLFLGFGVTLVGLGYLVNRSAGGGEEVFPREG